ncbi:MAG: helix-turn-helix domain-containing protein [Nitrospirae bacterium]|nr:helix-turn-helix domain-containing protein [Nitrospirota bacterium]
MTFGEFFNIKRRDLGLTLREFCRQNGFDVGNMSKMERDLLSPPQDREKLETYAKALKIKKGTDDWINFFDLASVFSGRIPEDIMRDEKIVSALPLLFRTIKDKAVTEKDLDDIIKTLRDE